MNLSERTFSDNLIREIENAFRDVAPPAPSKVVFADKGSDGESDEIAEALSEMDWRTIVRHPSRHHGQDIFLLTPEAVRYFLPGYMIACIKSDDAWQAIGESLEFLLTPPKDPSSSMVGYFDEIAALFTHEQGTAICEFFKWSVRKDPGGYFPDDKIFCAIEYWEQFGEESEGQ